MLVHFYTFYYHRSTYLLCPRTCTHVMLLGMSVNVDERVLIYMFGINGDQSFVNRNAFSGS